MCDACVLCNACCFDREYTNLFDVGFDDNGVVLRQQNQENLANYFICSSVQQVTARVLNAL